MQCLSARFNYAMMRGANISTQGAISWRSAPPQPSSQIAMRAPRSRAPSSAASDLAARDGAPISAPQCRPRRWRARARPGLSLVMRETPRPAAAEQCQVDQAAGHLAFEGVGSDFHGTATVSAGQVSDRRGRSVHRRCWARGSVALEAGVWRGRFTMMDTKRTQLGDVTFSHILASSSGTAHIDAPKPTFVPDKLQPEDLSPLLAAFRRAEGVASFTGDIDWTKSEIKSRGELCHRQPEFPHAAGQGDGGQDQARFHLAVAARPRRTTRTVTISRIDWTCRSLRCDLRFAFSPTDSEGQRHQQRLGGRPAALGAFTINLAQPQTASNGTAHPHVHRAGLACHRLQSGRAGEAGRQNLRHHSVPGRRRRAFASPRGASRRTDPGGFPSTARCDIRAAR